MTDSKTKAGVDLPDLAEDERPPIEYDEAEQTYRDALDELRNDN